MDFPPRQPFCDQSSDFLADVLKARKVHPEWLEKSSDRLSDWVDSAVGPPAPYVENCPRPQSTTPGRVQKLSMADVVHVRSDVPVDRVASALHLLLHSDDLDQLLTPSVCSTSHVQWRQEVARRKLSHLLGDALWIAAQGSHNLLAQELIGVGPYAGTVYPKDWESEPLTR